MSTLKQTIAALKIERIIQDSITAGRCNEKEVLAFFDEIPELFKIPSQAEKVMMYVDQFEQPYRAGLLANPDIFKVSEIWWHQTIGIVKARHAFDLVIAKVNPAEEITFEEFMDAASAQA